MGRVGGVLHNGIGAIKIVFAFIFDYWYVWLIAFFCFLVFSNFRKIDKVKYGNKFFSLLSVAVYLSLKDCVLFFKKLFVKLQEAGEAVRRQEEEEAARKKAEEEKRKNKSDKSDYIG